MDNGRGKRPTRTMRGAFCERGKRRRRRRKIEWPVIPRVASEQPRRAIDRGSVESWGEWQVASTCEVRRILQSNTPCLFQEPFRYKMQEIQSTKRLYFVPMPHILTATYVPPYIYVCCPSTDTGTDKALATARWPVREPWFKDKRPHKR